MVLRQPRQQGAIAAAEVEHCAPSGTMAAISFRSWRRVMGRLQPPKVGPEHLKVAGHREQKGIMALGGVDVVAHLLARAEAARAISRDRADGKRQSVVKEMNSSLAFMAAWVATKSSP